MTTPKLRILTLLARHGAAKYATALTDVEEFFSHRMPEASLEVLVIDNALPPEHVERLEPHVALIGGSNAAWEFSAWDAGMAHLGARIAEYDFINIVTSAFRQLYVGYLDRIDSGLLGLLQGRAAAFGHIDYFNDPVALLGIPSQFWLRSSFIFLPPAELSRLKSLTSITNRTPFFSGDPAAPFRADAPISQSYRRYILGWLTGEGTGQGTEWHSRFQLDQDTLPFFENKTMAIFNEQLLTNRLVAQGCAIVDMTWLATHVPPQLAARTLGEIPDWRAQLAARDINRALVL